MQCKRDVLTIGTINKRHITQHHELISQEIHHIGTSFPPNLKQQQQPIDVFKSNTIIFKHLSDFHL